MGKMLRAASLTKLIRRYGLRVGVEVGVAEGKMTRVLLENNGDLKLYGVDYWPPDHPVDHPEQMNGAKVVGPEESANRKRKFLKVVKDYHGRCKLIELPSLQAAAGFDDGSLDFVFIDADHSFEGVREDIIAWLPKVRSGGWLTGHDYNRPEMPGVTQAVRLELGEVKEKPGFVWVYPVA
jgi:hypothetical protein